ncbi:hypothetical protein [Agaribacterium sp. ZY112]|uniref:hypothetical protein n=1 Tax=Agaribacterium sp. ZY112 TaxID=3233574 RepID=UPI0035238177
MGISETRKIYKSACDRLGNSLENYGFKYRKTKSSAIRSGRQFDNIVSFKSSRHNSAELGYIHLEVRAMAWSEEFGDFRRSLGVNLPINENCLFGKPIENLFIPAPPYIKYDIGDDQQRELILSNIERILEEQVLLMFDLVESPSDLYEYLEENQIPCIEEYDSLDHYKKYMKQIGAD